jgi:hypothetical protein
MIDNNSVGKKAIAHSTPLPQGYGPELGHGTIVAYVPGPMVLIEEENGDKFWWIVDQTEVID